MASPTASMWSFTVDCWSPSVMFSKCTPVSAPYTENEFCNSVTGSGYAGLLVGAGVGETVAVGVAVSAACWGRKARRVLKVPIAGSMMDV